MKLDWEDIKIYKYLKDRKSNFIYNIDEMISYCSNILKYVNKVFDNYTNHDIEHSKMVIKYMSDLITNIEELSDLEITTIIYCGLLHDIGMVITNEEIELIKNNEFSLTKYKYECVYEKFNDEKLTIQEIIRPIHGIKSKQHILDNMIANAEFKKLFCIPNATNIMFYEEVADVCLAHNENFEWLKMNIKSDTIKGEYKLNSQFIAILLRIGDLLDIDEQRTPLYLYKLLSPKGISDLEWKQHFIIENTDKIVYEQNSNIKKIMFCGESKEPIIHRKILKYIEYINSELKNAVLMFDNFKNEYQVKLKPLVDNKIVTKNFSFSDFKLNLDYVAVTNLLMGENIYGDRKFGLRELIQNSIDACKLMSEESRSMQQYKRQAYTPYIRIEIDKDRNKVIIADNGIGMSLDIIKKYFFNIGVSYYSSDEFKFRGYKFRPIGNYGIGFLACFMLSNNVEVVTKRYDEHKVNEVSIEKDSEFICLTQKDDLRLQGTDIILDYKEFSEVFKDIDAIKRFVEVTFLDNEIPIIICENDGINYNDIKCNLVKLKEEEKDIIRLDNYLNNMLGYVDIKYRNMKFIKNLSQIPEDDIAECYVYDGYELKKEDDFECLNISELISGDDSIFYISIPIINEEVYDDFKKAYDVLDDYEEALEKIEPYYTINIFLKENFMPEIFMEDFTLDFDDSKIISTNEEFLKGIYKEDFSKLFGHNNEIPLIMKLHKQFIIDNKSDEFLCFGKKYQLYHYDNSRGGVCKIFNRDILLQGCSVDIPYWIDGVTAKELVLNIKNKYIIPNVARRDIASAKTEELYYSIGRAIYSWIYNNLELDTNKKNLLGLFIKKYYNKENPFIRSNK